jgi:pimeloyl-ACP methyl ester carboxylesterase
MIHGAGLSGKSYDTTPDGRMGWYEYFVRRSHPTYVVDQVGRARSGFNHMPLNRRLAGGMPEVKGPAAFRFGERSGVWTNFRFGPRYGEAFPDSQFPTDAAPELAKQAIPDLTALVPSPNPTFKALSDLAKTLKGVILLSHSQSGPFPMDAALIDSAGIRGIVSVEPGTCRSSYTDAQIAQLAKVPTLILFGDYLPVPTALGDTWQARFDGCRIYAARIVSAGGKVDLVRTPDLGIRGNSHMLMQDRNSNEIADVILRWIDGNAA